MLSEQKVQRAAQSLLHRRYAGRSWGKRIFSKMEVRTKRQYGGKRADGLLAFRHILWGEFVVSMEAKSFKTLNAIHPYKDHGSLILGSLKWGLYACLASGAAVAAVRQDDFFYKFWFPILVFVIAGALYAFFTRNHVSHQISHVIEQIRQYPADHQWLAISQDSLNRLSRHKRDTLKCTCKYQGIGVVVVNKHERAKVWIKPKWNWNWMKGYLHYYSKEQEIRAAI